MRSSTFDVDLEDSAAVAAGLSPPSGLARRMAFIIEFGIFFVFAVDLGLALFIAHAALELVPTLTRAVIPIAVIVLLRTEQVRGVLSSDRHVVDNQRSPGVTASELAPLAHATAEVGSPMYRVLSDHVPVVVDARCGNPLRSLIEPDGVAEVRVAFIKVDGVELTTARPCVPEDIEPIADVDHIDQSVFDDGVAPHHNLVQSLA